MKRQSKIRKEQKKRAKERQKAIKKKTPSARYIVSTVDPETGTVTDDQARQAYLLAKAWEFEDGHHDRRTLARHTVKHIVPVKATAGSAEH